VIVYSTKHSQYGKASTHFQICGYLRSISPLFSVYQAPNLAAEFVWNNVEDYIYIMSIRYPNLDWTSVQRTTAYILNLYYCWTEVDTSINTFDLSYMLRELDYRMNQATSTAIIHNRFLKVDRFDCHQSWWTKEEAVPKLESLVAFRSKF
jgi:hypothetical protein